MMGKEMGVLVNIVLLPILLIYCFPGEVMAIPGAQPDCQTRMMTCMANEGTKRPVCGDDNQTYPSKCHILQMQCDGQTIALKHKGVCSGKMNEKANTRRRSSARGRRNKKGCSRADRSLFSSNLLNIFRTEYERSRGTGNDSAVLDWKFSTVDSDQSDFLDRIEYHQLRRLLKKVVTPRRCARTFGRMCDTDRDKAITRREWSACLTRGDLAYGGAAQGPGVTPVDIEETEDDEKDSDGADSGRIGGKRPDRPTQRQTPTYKIQKTMPELLLQGSVTRVSGNLHGLDDPTDRSKDENDSNDCLSDRKSVLDEQKSDDAVLYVPECTADGRFQRVQCYRSTGYCWCVNQDSGKPIPGTSIKDQHPRCEALPNRPMKGCPDQRKAAFITNLMEFLKQEMVTGTNGTGIPGSPDNLKWHASKEEQIATWSFVVLDKNKNKVLERKEWKSFRVLVMSKNQLRRCGKKLPRYCDINHDRKISITEWLNCLEAQQGSPSSVTDTSSKAPTISKRKGPNPLESYLKGD